MIQTQQGSFKRKRIPAKTKLSPSTVLRRIIAYCKVQIKPPSVSLKDKQLLGNLVKEEFFSGRYRTKGYFKIKMTEPQGTFMVIVYPLTLFPQWTKLFIHILTRKENDCFCEN